MTILQIDERKAYGIDVEILWIKETDETFVHVNSRIEPFTGDFNIPCSKAMAVDVFNHPFVHVDLIGSTHP